MFLFILYWILACAISWSFYYASTPYDQDGWMAALSDPIRFMTKFGPSIAGLIILALSDPARRAAFAVSLLRTGGSISLILAVMVPALLTAGGLMAAAIVSGMDAAILLTGFSLIAAISWIALKTLMGGGLGEELGIRGVALPLLLERFGPRSASVIIGLAWAMWHLPALIGQPPLIWVAQAVLTVSVSLILTFAWLRTGGSLVVAVLFHGALNGWAAYAHADWAPQLATIDIWQVVRLLLLLLLSIAILPLKWEGGRSRRDRKIS